MKPTNYHLFDFLDFDPDLSRDESLWKAYKPTSVYEKDGDICINVPFQKQVLSNDMAPDTASPREEYTLVIRQYTSGITRLFIGFGEESMTDQSEMLQFSDRVKKLPLQVTQTEGEWLITTQDGIQRALIHVKPPVLDRWSELLPDPQETLDLRLYPDGKREIRLAAYDHFSPPRYDALPLAFCKRNGVKERATLSFESKPDECFAGTGERFAKMDLSGQTFFLKNQDGQGVNNRRTYKNIPFYLSSRMYGTFYHTCAHSKLSLAGQSTRSVQFLSDQAMLDVFVIAGDTMEEILRGYRDLTGYPSMPPLWSFGIWMSRMTYFSADEVNEICDRMRAEHYPCDVIHLDTGWFNPKEKWVDARREDILDAPYFHVVFTVPEELNPIIYSNQKFLYAALYHAASDTLSELAADSKYLGTDIGYICILHTWGSTMNFHPHIHAIVLGGGLDVKNHWKDNGKDFFLPIKVISKTFRRKYMAELKQLWENDRLEFHGSAAPYKNYYTFKELLNICYAKEWIPYCKKPFDGAESVIRYLGKYTHRIAISNYRIKGMTESTVTFSAKDYKNQGHWKEITLSGEEFIRRFLMHVPPKRFVRIRHYGLLSSRNKKKQIALCRNILGCKKYISKLKDMDAPAIIRLLYNKDICKCSSCGGKIIPLPTEQHFIKPKPHMLC